jgi:hypothetical protein
VGDDEDNDDDGNKEEGVAPRPTPLFDGNNEADEDPTCSTWRGVCAEGSEADKDNELELALRWSPPLEGGGEGNAAPPLEELKFKFLGEKPDELLPASSPGVPIKKEDVSPTNKEEAS